MNEFKVGDWVVNTTHSGYTPFQLKDSDFYGISKKNQVFFTNLKYWQPKLGEWCWFKSASDSAEFGEYVGKTEHGKYQMRPNSVTCIFNYSYCEPFIGTLPSFLMTRKGGLDV